MDSKKVIENFKIYINQVSSYLNSKTSTRERKVSFKDIVYFLSYKNNRNLSYDITNSFLKYKNVLDVTKSAIIKKISNVDYFYFELLNQNLLDFIYGDYKQRYIAVDGSGINLNATLNKDGFKLDNNGNYCTALLSCLYDVDKEMVINYTISNSSDERFVLKRQLKYVEAGDVLLMDRGYFSKELFRALVGRDINVVFRLVSSLAIVKKHLSGNCSEKIININIDGTVIKFKLIKYQLNGNDYFLGTTLTDQTMNFLMDLYWKRWKIETNFRHAKYDLSLKDIVSKEIGRVKQDIAIHNLIFILGSFFENIAMRNLNCDKYKINRKNSLKFVNKLLHALFYGKSRKKGIDKILRILSIIGDTVTLIQKNRHYKRIRKNPKGSKWDSKGRMYCTVEKK